MRPGPLLLLLAAAAAVAACGDAPTPDDGGGVTIRGDERLGWDQQAANATELGALRFAIYVDGARSEMAGVTCQSAPAAAGFPCSGQLPSMSPGTHTLELAAFVTSGEDVLESPRSPPFRVTVSPGLTAPSETRPDSSPDPGPDPSPSVRDAAFERMTAGAAFDDIIDAALTPGGALLIAERAGVLHTIPFDSQGTPSALIIDGTRAGGSEGALVAVGVDAGFARTGFIYVLQTTTARDGLTWQVARYRQAGDTFGERAVLVQFGTAPSTPAGAIEIGPDGRLYVALEDARARRLTRRGTEQEGVILRLNPDGSTPADQPAGSPVYAAGRGEARGFDWHPQTGALWTLYAEARGATRLSRVPADRRRARAGLADAEHPLLPALHATDMAFYRGDSMPALNRALLVAAENGLHRVRFDPQDTNRIISIDTMIDTPVRALMGGPDGQLFIATPQAVYRLRAQ